MSLTFRKILGALMVSAYIATCGGGCDGVLLLDSSGCRLSTSFEFSATAPFCIGTEPFTATFSNGVTQSLGQQDLYSSGNFAWHIESGTSATVTFETLPMMLTFFVRAETVNTVSDVMVLDENGDLITQVTPTTVFQQIVVDRAPSETLIGSVVVANTSGGDVVIDDFVFVN